MLRQILCKSIWSQDDSRWKTSPGRQCSGFFTSKSLIQPAWTVYLWGSLGCITCSFPTIQFTFCWKDVIYCTTKTLINVLRGSEKYKKVSRFWRCISLKWNYDESGVIPVEGILEHKQVSCMRRKMLFSIFKYLFVREIFKFSKCVN